MELEVRLFAGLKCENPDLPEFGQKEMQLKAPEGLTVRQLHELLKLDLRLPLVSMVNGLARAEDWELKDKDRIGIFPPVGGG